MAQRWSGWLFTLVWSMTGLLQLAAPPCVHHASATPATTLAAPLAEMSVHAAHTSETPHASHEHAAHEHAAAPTPEQPAEHSGHDAPCDCLTACCAAAAMVLLDAPTLPADRVVPAAAPIGNAPLLVAELADRDHRQPPATAPPGSRDR